MQNLFPMLTLLAVIYHESGRPSVEAGSTLAHSLGQGRSFVEFKDLRHEAQQGRELTAELLLKRFHFYSFTLADGGQHPGAEHPVDVETLARAIHECERPAIQVGWVAVVLDPSRPWIDFDALPEQAQTGRRNQARYLLDRFFIVAHDA